MGTLRSAVWGVSRIISQNGGPVSKALYQAANLYVKTYNNLNYDMATNGENAVLDRLSKKDVRVVFDVGANKGEYTAACLNRFDGAVIHAFEIVPATFRKLAANTTSSRARLNDFGLADAPGTLEINYNPDDDGSSSLVEGGDIHNGVWRKVQVNVSTGDIYCAQRDIGRIDLLKIDVEGAENLVLAGFLQAFRRDAVSAVQFEFGMANIYSKYLLRDFWTFFAEHGFEVGPIMPRGVNFRAYNSRDENFHGPPNFLAVHKSRPEFIDALRL